MKYIDLQKLVGKHHQSLLLEGIEHARATIPGSAAGSTKLDAAARFVAGKIDIPYIPESMEVWLLKAAISALYDLVEGASDAVIDAMAKNAERRRPKANKAHPKKSEGDDKKPEGDDKKTDGEHKKPEAKKPEGQ